jgi:DNA repair protein RadC
MTSDSSDDELLEACRDAQSRAVLLETARQLLADGPLFDELADAEYDSAERVAGIPAGTLVGLRAKAEIAERWMTRELGVRLLVSITKDAFTLLEATIAASPWAI